jgi:ribosome-binding factor A
VADAPRARKLADRIKVIVAEMLERRVKDPRLGFVTVTDARVTADLHEATVFYTVFGDDVARQETAAALESAKGVIRSEVGKRTGVRFTPTITFVLDAIPETTGHLDELLKKAAEADAEVQRVAANASHAGEADPYRAPREIVDEDDTDEDDGDDERTDSTDDGGGQEREGTDRA